MQLTTPSSHPPAGQQPSPGCTVLGRAGCGLVFILLGGMPILAALNLLPGEDFFGESPPWIAVTASFAFVLLGVYFLALAASQPARRATPFPRWLADLLLFIIAIPFHYWLFFGKSVEGGGLSIGLPGVSIELPRWVSLLEAKLVVGVIVLMIDLLLISEIAGLGWFVWVDPDDDDGDSDFGSPT